MVSTVCRNYPITTSLIDLNNLLIRSTKMAIKKSLLLHKQKSSGFNNPRKMTMSKRGYDCYESVTNSYGVKEIIS